MEGETPELRCRSGREHGNGRISTVHHRKGPIPPEGQKHVSGAEPGERGAVRIAPHVVRVVSHPA